MGLEPLGDGSPLKVVAVGAEDLRVCKRVKTTEGCDLDKIRA